MRLSTKGRYAVMAMVDGSLDHGKICGHKKPRLSGEVADWLRERVTGELYCDSRHLRPGDGFVAWPGAATDGRRFVADALRAGHLGGAATDVLSQEPPKDGNPLLAADIPRLIITPHNAWGSREARQRIVGQLSENALAFFSGTAIRVVG